MRVTTLLLALSLTAPTMAEEVFADDFESGDTTEWSAVLVVAESFASSPGTLSGCRDYTNGHCAFPDGPDPGVEDDPANVNFYAAPGDEDELDAAAPGLLGKCVQASGAWGPGPYDFQLDSVPTVLPDGSCESP